MMKGGTRAVRRVLVAAAATALSAAAAGPAGAQSSEWLELRGPTALTLRNGETVTYYIRMKKRPILMDDEGIPVLVGGEEQPVTRADAWWVRVRADGAVRNGRYDVDGDPNTGLDDPETPEREGYDLIWRPSLGRDFWEDNWNTWQGIRIEAHSDIGVPVVFSHEVWSNERHCPEHGVVPVTVSTSGRGAPGVRVAPTAMTIGEGLSDPYQVVLLSQPSGNVRVRVAGQSGDVTTDRSSLEFTTRNWNEAQSVTVYAGADADAEQDGPVTLTHSASGGGYSGVAIDDVVVTIREDDQPSTAINLSINPESIREAGGRQQVTVTGELNDAIRGTATTLTLSVVDGTADSSDYSATGATLTIPAGRVSGAASVHITPVNDTLDEDPDETVTIRANTTSGLNLSGDSFTVTIEDDDGRPPGSISRLRQERSARTPAPSRST